VYKQRILSSMNYLYEVFEKFIYRYYVSLLHDCVRFLNRSRFILF